MYSKRKKCRIVNFFLLRIVIKNLLIFYLAEAKISRIIIYFAYSSIQKTICNSIGPKQNIFYSNSTWCFKNGGNYLLLYYEGSGGRKMGIYYKELRTRNIFDFLRTDLVIPLLIFQHSIFEYQHFIAIRFD